MFRPDQNGDLLQPWLGMALAQQSKAAVHAKPQVQYDRCGGVGKVRHDIVQMVLCFHYMGDQLHAVITQIMQGFGASVRKGGLVFNEQDDLAEIAHLLVELRQRCLCNVTCLVIHNLYQRLGKELIIAFAGGQLRFWRPSIRVFRERRNVFRTNLIFKFMLIGQWIGSVSGEKNRLQNQIDRELGWEWELPRENSKSYFFTAATRALRRDLYREPVFLWITPFFTALSIMETVLLKASWAALESPVASVSRSLRSAVRRREVLERLSSVRLVVWRARFSAEK